MLPAVAELDNKLMFAQHLYTVTRTIIQVNGLVELSSKLNLNMHINVLSDCGLGVKGDFFFFMACVRSV